MSQRSPFNKRNIEQATDQKPASSGMSRKGASSAKPARAAASTVRVVSAKTDKDGFTTTKNMTKQERKDYKHKQRDEENEINGIADMVVRHNDLYRHRRNVWWVFMVVGVAMVVVTFALNYINVQTAEDGTTTYANATLATVSIVTLVLAYVFIITSLVWEWTKIRPIRNQTIDQVRSMSKKRRIAVVERCEAEDEARKANKKSPFGKNNAKETEQTDTSK